MGRIQDTGYLEGLIFDNIFVSELPGDPERENRRRQVRGACYSLVEPTHVSGPALVAYSKEVAEDLGLVEDACNLPEFLETMAGNKVIPGMEPHAMCYGGHQFGSWAGQLGDGRAINLGDVVSGTSGRQTLQLKGAGPTPYSRTADGLAVLRSSVREFLCSEAMYYLGVPTTRALSLVLTGESVERDMFYDGHPREEPGAVVCRVAPTFLRFGNFELLASRGETHLLKQLIDYTITHFFSHLGAPSEEIYCKWFNEVCLRTAEMILHWMRVGFVHGVMNTDNMSILGLTIDYGPYGWLEGFDTQWTPNTTDAHGRRYCFGNQPHIAQWNLVQLANALHPVLGNAEALQEGLSVYTNRFQEGWNSMVAKKLGLDRYLGVEDDKLFDKLFGLFSKTETDMTIFFRNLARLDGMSQEKDNLKLMAPFSSAFYTPSELSEEFIREMGDWVMRYLKRVSKCSLSETERKIRMLGVNPKYVFRNYLAHLATEKAEKGDFSMIWELLETFRAPYEEQPEREKFAKKRPEWARKKPGCSMLSCSS